MTANYFSSLRPSMREMAELSMQWQDQFWNPETALLKLKTDRKSFPLPMVHHIRETIWYALGLLQRATEGDYERALLTIEAVLRYQFDEPGKPYDGTWYRYPEEPHPGTMPIWRGYDPNWREFIGTALVIILHDYETELPATLVASIDEALRKAVRGARARGLSPTYTNIALMYAFLLDFTGKRFAEPGWVSVGEAFARETYQLFAPNHTFSEFNSPTYYGVDFYALGLWRSYSSSPLLRQLGAEMEAALWHDVALMYHAGMQNMAGPFDRSYGMDLRRYASLIGLWLWLALGKEHAPFPAITAEFEHDLDFCYVPCYIAVDVSVPEDVLPTLRSFQGERQVERVIANEPRRVATAWIGDNLLLGGEETSYSKPASDQFHPVTVQWRTASDQIGWLKLLYSMDMRINARAEKNCLTFSLVGDGITPLALRFQLYAPDGQATLQAERWLLTGLSVAVETNTHFAGTKVTDRYYEIAYAAHELAPNENIYFTLTTTT